MTAAITKVLLDQGPTAFVAFDGIDRAPEEDQAGDHHQGLPRGVRDGPPSLRPRRHAGPRRPREEHDHRCLELEVRELLSQYGYWRGDVPAVAVSVAGTLAGDPRWVASIVGLLDASRTSSPIPSGSSTGTGRGTVVTGEVEQGGARRWPARRDRRTRSDTGHGRHEHPVLPQGCRPGHGRGQCRPPPPGDQAGGPRAGPGRLPSGIGHSRCRLRGADLRAPPR